MKLTTNLYRHEMACHCGNCDCDTVDFQTASLVQECADHFSDLLGRRVVVDVRSAHRCEEYNASPQVGGAPGSYHLSGQALDFSIDGVKPSELYGYFDDRYPNTLGLGLYNSFVHVDCRIRKARWQG